MVKRPAATRSRISRARCSRSGVSTIRSATASRSQIQARVATSSWMFSGATGMSCMRQARSQTAPSRPLATSRATRPRDVAGAGPEEVGGHPAHAAGGLRVGQGGLVRTTEVLQEHVVRAGADPPVEQEILQAEVGAPQGPEHQVGPGVAGLVVGQRDARKAGWPVASRKRRQRSGAVSPWARAAMAAAARWGASSGSGVAADHRSRSCVRFMTAGPRSGKSAPGRQGAPIP